MTAAAAAAGEERLVNLVSAIMNTGAKIRGFSIETLGGCISYGITAARPTTIYLTSFEWGGRLQIDIDDQETTDYRQVILDRADIIRLRVDTDQGSMWYEA